jgi:hypothetical protein
MAEDDLDLEDDDLDLGGDDFAGELDDMMGDDELGGDSDGGSGEDSDSELDSFFEDLSSIEDMDEGGSEPAPAAAAVAAPAAAEEAAPAQAKPVKQKEKKKGGKLKYVILLLIIGGVAGYFTKDMWMPLLPFEQEEMFPPLEPEPIQTIKLETEVSAPQPAPVKPPAIVVEPPPPVPAPVRPTPPARRYLVQVATCTYDVCKEDFTDSLRRTGEPVFQRSSAEKYDFIELVSSQVFTYREASQFVKEINTKNKLAGKASVKSQSNGYRISMGSFPALDRAKEIKFGIEKLFPGKNVTFNLEHVRKDYSNTKIYAGPYSSRSVAKKKLTKLIADEKFSGAFVVRY